jgi:hypothetical protein
MLSGMISVTDRVETHLDILAVNGPLPAAVSGAPW